MLSFKSLEFEEAKRFVGRYHADGMPNRGQYCFGAFMGDKLIAATIYLDSRSGLERVGELVSAVKDPMIPNRTFQLSRLFAKSTRELRNIYDLVISYADTRRGPGISFQGASWCYDGIVPKGHYHLPPQVHLYEPDHGYHLYWKALTNTGYNRARQMNLRSLRYIRRKPQFVIQAVHV